MEFTIENRQIKPAVYPIFQNENDTTVLKFTLANYIHDDTVDLRNYTAYAVTSQNGLIDMTELESEYDESNDTLTISWNVQEYSLREAGAIQYQIVFKENADDGENTAVYYSNKAILMNRMSINADDHITANYPTLLKQWLDRINQLSGDANKGFFYIPYGETIPPSERLEGTMYWQWDNEDNTAGHFEDDSGNVLTFSQYKERTKYLPNQDLLGDMTKSDSADQHYFTAGAAIKNAPIATSYCLVKQYDSDSTDRFIQEVQVPDGNNVVRTFVRCVSGHKEYGTEKVGEWRELATTEHVKNATPAGTVIAFAGLNIPDGYLLCNGAAVSRTTYAALFKAIGTIYGAGDGSTTFNLPNLINRFIEGSETAGTVKEAGLPNIAGKSRWWQSEKVGGSDTGALSITSAGTSGGYGGSYNKGNYAMSIDASKSNPIYGASDTVQPPAITMKYCIKY